jgi:hypothetical protein
MTNAARDLRSRRQGQTESDRAGGRLSLVARVAETGGSALQSKQAVPLGSTNAPCLTATDHPAFEFALAEAIGAAAEEHGWNNVIG